MRTTDQISLRDNGFSGVTGRVFDIQRFSLHDGPGIRTVVFLKGCPLRCLWCDNPESQEFQRELGFMRARCDKCAQCVAACSLGAISIGQDGLPRIDRKQCNLCGRCAQACFPKALIVYGRDMTAAEVLEEVRKDEIFYSGSAGGVTLSGGEPLYQPRFARAILSLCHKAGIHTAIETCGFFNTGVLEGILPVTDLMLFDLKYMNSKTHRFVTGRPNGLIVKNARAVVRSGKPVLFRFPVVPGMNDVAANVSDTAHLVKDLQGSKAAIELMPYHRLGSPKYEALDKSYPLDKVAKVVPPEPEYLLKIKRAYEDMGVRCSISR